MKALLFISLLLMALSPAKDTRYFELRIYYAPAGKLDALIERFRGNTTRIFEKHGMQNIGYWVPVDNQQNALYYILAYPSKEARAKAWDAFRVDPEWLDVKTKTEANGKLVDSVKQVFMYTTDLLPAMNTASKGPDRVFELRTYPCNPGKLPNLLTRFRDHTLKIFEGHGMQNIEYWVSEEPTGKQSDLVYIIAHKDMDGAKKSWADFLVDPAWVKVRDDSEKDGKILSSRPESVYLKPLPFSKIK
ncbi:MAG TPA: NIPSNAP family protein [Cyclobacteriaceae bacterium]|nr:NIPSNAP family protein [Cyclobacteriaceae bacterium]